MMKYLLLTLVLIAPFSTFGYTQEDIDSANSLAQTGLIVDHTDAPADYRLDDTITRAEVIGTALKMAGVLLPGDYFCQNYYDDVTYDPVNNWICRAVELGADRSIVSRANRQFRPQDQITRAEVIAILTDSLCLHGIGDGELLKSTQLVQMDDWQKKVIQRLYARKIQVPHTNITYTNQSQSLIASYDYFPNEHATRSFVFSIVDQLSQKGYYECDKLVSFDTFEYGFVLDQSVVESFHPWTEIVYSNGNKIEKTHDKTMKLCFGDWKYVYQGDSLVETNTCAFISKLEGNKLDFLLDEEPFVSLDIGYFGTSQLPFYHLNTTQQCSSQRYITFVNGYSITFPYECVADTFASDVQLLALDIPNPDLLDGEEMLQLYFKLIGSQDTRDIALSMVVPGDTSQSLFASSLGIGDTLLVKEDSLSEKNNTYSFELDVTNQSTETSTYDVKVTVDEKNFTLEFISFVEQKKDILTAPQEEEIVDVDSFGCSGKLNQTLLIWANLDQDKKIIEVLPHPDLSIYQTTLLSNTFYEVTLLRGSEQVSHALVKSDNSSHLFVQLPDNLDDLIVHIGEYKSQECLLYQAYGEISIQDDRQSTVSQITMLFNGYASATRATPSVSKVQVKTSNGGKIIFDIVGSNKGTIELTGYLKGYQIIKQSTDQDPTFSYDEKYFGSADELHLSYGDNFEKYRIVEIYNNYK